MTFQILQPKLAGHTRPHQKVTCVTCQLKRCVGRCRWEPAGTPRPRKIA